MLPFSLSLSLALSLLAIVHDQSWNGLAWFTIYLSLLILWAYWLWLIQNYNNYYDFYGNGHVVISPWYIYMCITWILCQKPCCGTRVSLIDNFSACSYPLRFWQAYCAICQNYLEENLSKRCIEPLCWLLELASCVVYKLL